MRGSSTIGFPPFTPAVKKLVIANVAVYLALFVSRLFSDMPQAFAAYFLYLHPVGVLRGYLWQLITYSFIHGSISHILFNMIGLWMFGSAFEMDFGSRKFYEFYFWCVLGAALTTMAVGAIGVYGYQATSLPIFAVMRQMWFTSTIGASGGVYGLLAAYGILHGEQTILLYFVVPIKARYFVIGALLLVFLNAFSAGNSVAEFAHLGGALFGWLYLTFVPRYGLQTAASESAFGLRNRYYRWKRRQAARKFEVYMRKNNRREYFDQNGNYIGPKGKDDDSGWVN
jgi:membrane associated rhomboid family serine protease